MDVKTDELTQQACRLFERDVFSRQLRIELIGIGKGWAKLRMEIGHHATNTHGSWHGGAAFTFADMAFGCATLYDGPALTVESSLSFLAPGTPGDRVQAEAIQLARRKQTGLFQVTLTSSSGEMLCAGMFKGRWIRSQDG